MVTGRRAGHRYTLTEGDFHHLKNARLTHLHLPPLKIITIHECDSGEASATTPPHAAAAPKASLAIFQVSVRAAASLVLSGRDTHPLGWAPHLGTGRGRLARVHRGLWVQRSPSRTRAL